MDTCYIYLRKLSIYFNRAVPLDQYRSCWIQNLTYGSGEWSGFDPCLTYCVHWKTRNAKLARKSRADSRPDTGRNWNPVLPKYKKQVNIKLVDLMPVFFGVQWFEITGVCSFCWYWWNWWPSLFKLYFHIVLLILVEFIFSLLKSTVAKYWYLY